MTNTPKTGKKAAPKHSIPAYKLSELAKRDGIHYQTAITRRNNGEYMAVTISRGAGPTIVRYFDRDTTNLLMGRKAGEITAGPAVEYKATTADVL